MPDKRCKIEGIVFTANHYSAFSPLVITLSEVFLGYALRNKAHSFVTFLILPLPLSHLFHINYAAFSG